MEITNSIDTLFENIAKDDPNNRTVPIAMQISELIDSLTEARINQDITQRELAVKCGIKQSAIARMEKMQVLPRIDTIIKIADALGVKIVVHNSKKTEKSNIIRIKFASKPSYNYVVKNEDTAMEALYGTIG